MSATGAPWEVVIGLEVHVQLQTKSKLFCRCPTVYGAPPNTQVCPVCLGYPGVLPVLNREAVALALKMALALGCRIRKRSRFARKNYFYPDLPKGYQISQHDEPLAEDGAIRIEVDGKEKAIGVTRIHMEEDAGKLLHGADGASLVDFNRSGVALIECVSRPDLRSTAEAYAYLTELKAVVEYTGVSNANMEEGSLRCDANLSLRPAGRTELGTRTEIKNLNSFRNVERALTYEAERQRAVLEAGGTVAQETRQWDAARGETVVLRSKEEAHDYRYFPEPDLPPLEVADEWIEEVRATLPELPHARWQRLRREHGLPSADARVLSLDRGLADYFEAAARAAPGRSGEAGAAGGTGGSDKDLANWILRDGLRWTSENRKPIAEFPVRPESLAELVVLVAEGTISSAQAKTVFEKMVATGSGARAIVGESGLAQVSDAAAIEAAVRKVVAASPAEADRYRAGKKGLLGFFVGQTMKEMEGRANPKMVSEIAARVLDEKPE